jgi:excisionase family DNA binding protein
VSNHSPILLIDFLSSNSYFGSRMVSRNNKNATVQRGGSTTQPQPLQPQSDRLLLRGGEVAALLGVSRALAFQWMQEGILPTVRITGARTVRVPRIALLEWIEQNTGTGLAPSQRIPAERVTDGTAPAPTSRRGGTRNVF